MSRHALGQWLFIAGTILGVAGNGPRALGEDALSDFMKVKLIHAQKTLEGLATADYDAIAKHSQAINLLCEDEKWAVVKSLEYHERTREFQRSVYAITEAARQKNLEAATVAYVDATLKCVSCHNYMRKTKSGQPPGGPGR